MTFGDLHLKSLYTQHKFNQKLPQQFWGDFEWLEGLSVGNPLEMQRQAAQQLEDVQGWERIRQNLQHDIKDPVIMNEAQMLKHIQDIEDAIGYKGLGGLKTKNKEITSEQLKAFIGKHDTLLMDLKNIYNMFDAQKSRTIIKALERLDLAIKDLEADVSALTGEPAVFSNRGYLQTLNWVEWHLKGYLLEAEGTKFLQERIPDLESIKIVNTGDILGPTLDIFGGVQNAKKQLGADIMAFDKEIAKNIFITYEIDKQKRGPLSLLEFLQVIEDNAGEKTITIFAEDYPKIQTALIAGIQAKSGQGNIKFRVVSPATLFGSGTDIARALESLNWLMNNKWGGQLKQKDDIYDAMFNLELSRHLTGIIGKDNTVMLTRDGFQSTKEFLINAYNQGKMIMGLKPINLKTCSPVAVGLGKSPY